MPARIRDAIILAATNAWEGLPLGHKNYLESHRILHKHFPAMAAVELIINNCMTDPILIASAMASPEDRDRARDAGKPFIGLIPHLQHAVLPLRDVLDEDEIFFPNPLRGPHRNKNQAAQSYLAHDRLIQHFASATYKGSPAYTAMHRLFYEFFTNLDYEDQNQIALHRLILQEHGTQIVG